jgi:pilin isopeptide linkage protein/uncharacterized repeat protein (TIGR01451 family)
VITSQSDTWSNGVTATYSVDYTIDQGSMSEGDYVLVSIPTEIVSNVDWSVSSQHFSKVEDLGGGQYKLIFGPNAASALNGSFAVNLTMKNDTNTAQSGTIAIGSASKTMTVNPRSSSSGTSGTETRAIIKDVSDPDDDVGFGGYDSSDGQDNAKQIGVIKATTDGVYQYRVFVNPKKTNMSNITVNDILPGGMHFMFDSAPTVEYYESGRTAETVDSSLYQITRAGDKLTFTYPGELNRCIQIDYKVSVDDTKNAKYTNTASIDYTENGKVYSEYSGYVLQGTNYSAVNGEKQVNKTEITNADKDQQVMYSFKFWNNKVTAAGKINFSDTLDSHVRFDGAVSSDYFSITQDAQNPHVIHVTNKLDLPADKTFYARFFINMSGVPAGYTVMNTAGGNTVYTTKDAEVNLTAAKTLNGQAPGKNHIYQFELLDKDGNVLQTKENNADGKIQFDPIEYSESDVGKTFNYTVKEKKGDDSGTTYDSTVYKVSVKVAQSGKDQPITAASTIMKGDQKVDAMTFANTSQLQPAAASITAVKTLSGRAIKDGEFNFTISAAAGTPMPEKTTAANKADGTIDFGAVTYNQAGTYTYTVREDAGDVKGVTYDSSEKIIVVEVTDDGNGQLQAKVIGNGKNAAFKNKYDAAGSAVIKGQKTVNGRKVGKLSGFTFTLTPVTAQGVGTGLPIKTVTAADGSFAFDALNYDLKDVGTHYYLLNETNLSKGYQKDFQPKLIKVAVTDNGDGTLKAKAEGMPANGYTLDNTYTTTHVTPIVPHTGVGVKTGDTVNAIAWLILACAAGIVLVTVNRKRDIEK